ncbi:glucokinase [Alphaproteobacteria bacterium LSUCC0719]
MSLIVADVGGTNARFAIASQDDPELRHVTYLRCADFENLDDACMAFLGNLPGAEVPSPHALSLAVAGPVNDRFVELSNNHWRFEKARLLDSLQLDRLLVINDFTAQALAQHGADDTGTIEILGGVRDAGAPILVIGPGTGLGVSALIPLSQGPLPIEGEGGNIRFAPRSQTERELDDYVRRQAGPAAVEHVAVEHVAVEHVVSGPGLETVHAFLADRQGGAARLTAERIGKAALDGEGLCRQAVHLMLGVLGGVMADHVLTMGCWGGAVIAGGITPKLAPLIPSSPFEKRFRDAGAMSPLLAKVPVWLSQDPDAGLRGARAAFGNPYLAHRMVTSQDLHPR